MILIDFDSTYDTDSFNVLILPILMYNVPNYIWKYHYFRIGQVSWISNYNISSFSVIIIIIIIKKDWQCKAGRGRLTPCQSEDPSPTLPTYRGKEEKGKIVEDKKLESS